MRKEPIVFGGTLGLSVLASQYLPALLNLPASEVQEAIMVVIFPILLAFLWWVW